MNPILRFLYFLFKVTVRTGARIYYPDTVVLNRERLRFKGPALLVSNHPNTLMDVLNTAAKVDEQVFFLANAGLFSTPFTNWLFNTLYCIPIQRPADTGGKPLQNDEAFARCDAFLAGGGTLYIAPEGGSEMERRLRPLKTGTARIGFSAESKADYALGLIIQPVGLSYGSFLHCGGRLVVNAAEPIRFADFREAYEKDPQGTVRDVTTLLENRLRDSLIDTTDATEDGLARGLESMLQHEEPLKGEARFRREKELTVRLADLHKAQPDAYADLLERAAVYFASGVRDITVKNGGGGHIVAAIAGFLPFLYGYLNHILPIGIPKWLAKKLNIYIGYTSTVKFALGALTVPLFYWLQTRLVSAYVPGYWWIVYLTSLPLSAWWLWRYNKILRLWRSERKWRGLSGGEREKMKATREDLAGLAQRLMD